MDLLDKVIAFADDYDMFPKQGIVLVALSGGADSMTLLDLMLRISNKRNIEVAAAHFNHRLRAEEADRDEAFVVKECKERGVKLTTGAADVKDYALSNGIGIEEAARKLRYGFLSDLASELGAVRIATAHNADDVAETLIMNITRGCGALGVSSIPPKRDNIIRPMLNVSRAEIMEYIGERGISFVEDSTNNIEDRTRNKIRHSVIPVLREINPRFVEAAGRLTELVRRDEQYISAQADEYIDKLRERSLNINNKEMSMNEIYLPVSAGDLPYAVSSRIIRKICRKPLSVDRIDAILDLCGAEAPSAAVSIPGMTIRREYDRIFFESCNASAAAINKPEKFEPIALTPGETQSLPELGFAVTCRIVQYEIHPLKSFNTFYFNVSEICGKISVRSRREGDLIKLFGTNCTKTLKKLFIERCIPAAKRQLIPVVADDEGVLAICGIGMGSRALPIPSEPAFEVIFRDYHLTDNGI